MRRTEGEGGRGRKTIRGKGSKACNKRKKERGKDRDRCEETDEM